MLVLLSVYSTLRYGLWRCFSVFAYFRDPATQRSSIDSIFISILLLAECYAFVVLALGYLQTLWPLRRAPAPLPTDPDEWPDVDLLIPTLNEPLSVVRFTALAALNIDWPAEKLHVYLLDDGRREDFRAFAEEAGLGYIARETNEHAKAGNINFALRQITSPYVAIFDCDQVPTRSFLQLTMGWFLRDQKLAVLQTPQRHYSPDPFERNLDQFQRVPNEEELFYGVVQDGNDFWNATYFCGSCAVLRRSALDDVGGVAGETSTEDAHTSLRMQMRGWNTAYVNIPQAAGLASERLSGHIRQRIRWARGMVQILRLENPLTAGGLKPAQRLCYFNAMFHFLFALPRLIFLTAPVLYLIFGIKNIPGLWLTILAYALPHLLLSKITHSRLQGRHRHSFWNEIHETVLAPYILLPTLFALIRPQTGPFHVTTKGGVVDQDFFDARVARPYILLAALNAFGLLCAVARLVRIPLTAAPNWLAIVSWPTGLYDPGHAGAIWINIAWTMFNLIVLGVATAVAWESQQRRRSTRVALAVPSDVILSDGSIIQGMTSDLSSGGVRTRLNQPIQAKPGDLIDFVFPVLDGSASLPATIISLDGGEIRAQFNSLTLQEDEALALILYSRADAWLAYGTRGEADRPIHSLGHIVHLSLRGLAQTLAGPHKKTRAKGGIAASVILTTMLAQAAWMAQTAHVVHAQTPAAKLASASLAGAHPNPPNSPFDNLFTLADAGAKDAIKLRGVYSSRSINFSVPRNQVVKTASLRLHYQFSPGLIPAISQLKVSLNGTLISTLAVSLPSAAIRDQTALESTVNLPADLLVHQNQLTFELIAHYTLQCEDQSSSTLWAEVDQGSTIQMTGSLLPLSNDLNILPDPFVEDGNNTHPVISVVFLSSPSAKAIQASGIIASWVGLLQPSRPLRFSTSVVAIPSGNVIALAEFPSQIPASLGAIAISGPTVTMANNPSDPTSKLLLVTGNNPDELLTAATALSLQPNTWKGSQVTIRDLALPALRHYDDAPRWLGAKSDNGQIVEASNLQGDGTKPATIYMRLPPDLDFGERKNLAFHLNYRYNGVPLGTGSTLQVFVNGLYVSSTPMPHTDNASTVLETIVPIPVVNLRPFSNTLTFQFAFRPANKDGCPVSATNLQGAVLKDSYLDISGIPHSTVLPNLELFANAGYPFTRQSDLADTAVVLPDQPSTGLLDMFLTLMGHLGAQTGYPALRVTVTDPAGMSSEGRTDYLVLAASNDLPAAFARALPVQIGDNRLIIHDTPNFLRRTSWLSHRGSGSMQTDGGLPDALIEGIEWPAGSNRTAVLVFARDDSAISGFLSAFLDQSQSSNISESASVLHDGHFTSYRIGNEDYRVGQISFLERVENSLESAPWMIAIGVLFLCFVMAALIQAMLRRHARVRLHGDPE